MVDASEDLQSHRVKEVIPVSLDRIVKRFRLKRRTETVCQSNGLTDLRKIYQFKIEYGDFKKLRGCGATTEAELERVFLHALEIRALDDLDMEGSSQGDRLTKIPADLHDHFGQLSVRARNAMIAYSGEDDQDALIRVIAYSDIDLLKIRNIGRKTLLELEEFRLAARIQLKIPPATRNDISGQASRNTLRTLSSNPILRSIILPEFIEDNGRVRVFDLLNAARSSWATGKGFWRMMAIRSTRIGGTLKIRSLLSGVGVKNWRVANPRHFDVAFDRHFGFLAGIEAAERLDLLDQGSAAIVLDERIIQGIDLEGKEQWAPDLIARILAILSQERYKYLSWGRLSFVPKRYRELDFSFPLLVKAEIVRELIHVFSHIQPVLRKPNRSELRFDITRILQVTDEEARPVLEALRIMLPIVSRNAKVEGRAIVAPRRSAQRKWLLIKALEAIDRPAHISELAAKLNTMSPGTEWRPATVRGVAIRAKPHVISFSRTSTYGLKKWENRPGIHGGTLKDIMAEYLAKLDRPCHASELVEHLAQYRKRTTVRNIIGNLIADTTGHFIRFPQGFIGLAGKVYGELPMKWVSPIVEKSGRTMWPRKKRRQSKRSAHPQKPTVPVKKEVPQNNKIREPKRQRYPGDRPTPSFFKPAYLQRFIGRSKLDLVMHIHARSGCGIVAVMEAVDHTVEKGRLVLDQNGVIKVAR